MESLDFPLAQKTVRDYVCSNCWGDLQMYFAPLGRYEVLCLKCGSETKGYVTRYFANYRRSESGLQIIDVTRLLEGMGVIPGHEKKSQEQLLKELGF